MKRQKPSICVLHMGGSTIDGLRKLGLILQRDNTVDIESSLPEAKLLADLQIELLNEDTSPSMLPEIHWTRLAEAILRHNDQVDGFVVVHGKDTLPTTASGIAFLLQDLGKPIIFTGSSYHFNGVMVKPKHRQIVQNNQFVDTKFNLLNAILAATLDLAEVGIVFGDDIIRAVAAKRFHELERNIFTSFSTPPLGRTGVRAAVFKHAIPRPKRLPKPSIAEMNWNVGILRAYQGMRPEQLMDYAKGLDGLIVEGFGIGSIPNGRFNNWLPTLHKLLKAGLPIVIVASSPDGLIDLSLYDYQKDLEARGLISGGSMTVDAAYAKLMWALKQTTELSELQKLFATDLLGELPEL